MLGHLRTLAQLAEMGAIILPPVPAFYAEPHTISDIVDQMVGRALDLLGYDWPTLRRWGEDLAKGRASREDDTMTEAEEQALRAKLAELVQEHRDLDAAIAALIANPARTTSSSLRG